MAGELESQQTTGCSLPGRVPLVVSRRFDVVDYLRKGAAPVRSARNFGPLIIQRRRDRSKHTLVEVRRRRSIDRHQSVNTASVRTTTPTTLVSNM